MRMYDETTSRSGYGDNRGRKHRKKTDKLMKKLRKTHKVGFEFSVSTLIMCLLAVFVGIAIAGDVNILCVIAIIAVAVAIVTESFEFIAVLVISAWVVLEVIASCVLGYIIILAIARL